MTTDRPNNRTNYHSHCSFCDGKAPMEDFVEEAVRQGFAAYGISSHAPLPFPARWTLEAERMAAYLAEIDRLKAAYADRIELYAGLEIDYLNEQSNPASDYFQKLPLDYRIGSVHLISPVEICRYRHRRGDVCENLRLHFGDDLRKLVTDYFDKLMRMVSTGGFDFVGHADKIVYNASQCQPDIAEQPWYRQKIREYFETIARHGAMVEINTKKYHAGGVFFPNRSHFRLLRELRIPVLVNS
ncbi:MAG: histidinol-phosphatase, partial [Alistipes sp.]